MFFIPEGNEIKIFTAVYWKKFQENPYYWAIFPDLFSKGKVLA